MAARVVAENENGPDLTVGSLTRGDHFGGQGLLTTSRRQYTIAPGDPRATAPEQDGV